ncbi:hypothetical protein Tco_0190521, partial [Tanacetum coccineum]
ANDVDVHLYRSMIGSLMYLTTSRPDIMFAVCACSRYQVTPKSSHLSAVKRIFRYLKGKPKLGLWYPRVSFFDLESYSDSDYAGRLELSFRCCPQQEVVNFLAEDSFLSNARSRPLWLLLLLKQNMLLLQAAVGKFCGFRIKCLKEFRELLSRVTNGTKALLLPTLFFLWLDKVSTACAKLVPLGKVCTAFETIKTNIAKALISIFTSFSISSTMAILDSCPKHNMVAYLEKSEGNVEFHEIIDFLTQSSINHALTVSPIISTTFVEQFWTSAKSKTINNVRHITAKVAGKSVSISEASIRSDLLFDDADGIDTLPNQDIFDAIQQMGSKSTSWDQIPTNIATAVICLTSNQKYNFSKLIFDGKQLVNVPVPLDHFPVNNLTSKVFSFMVKKGKHFFGNVTPLFASMLVQPTQDEGASSERPSEALPTPSPAPTSEVPLEPQPDSSPAQTSEVPFEQQTDQSPRPSPTTTIPDSIPETSGENLGGHSSSDKSLSGNEGDMTLQSVYDLCLSLCAQVSDQAKEIQDLKAQITKLKKQAKPVIKHHKAYLKSVSLKQRFPRKSFSKKHRVHKESVSKQGRKFAKENAHNEGRIREIVDEDKEIDENILSTEDVLSADKDGVSTDMEKVTEDHNEGTEEHNEGTEEKNEGTKEQVESTNGQKRYFSTLMRVLSIFDREDLNVVYQLVMDRYQDEIPEGFDRVLWGDLMVMFNPDDKDEFWNSQQDWNIYPLRKEVLMQMLKLKLESEEDSTMALELIRHKNWLVHKQTACGKDFSNPFMVDNLPKIVGFSTHLASMVKSWLVHDQTVHGKNIKSVDSDSLLKTIWLSIAPVMAMKALA